MWGFGFICGLIFAVVAMLITDVPPAEICASAFSVKITDVTWHDGKCWKRNADTPLTLAQ